MAIEAKSVGTPFDLVTLGTITPRYQSRSYGTPTNGGYSGFTINGVRAIRKSYTISEVEVRKLTSSNRVFRWSYQGVQDTYYTQTGTILYISLSGMVSNFDQLLSITWLFQDDTKQYNTGNFIPYASNDVILSQGGQNFSLGFNYSKYNYSAQYFYTALATDATSITFPENMGCHISVTYLAY